MNIEETTNYLIKNRFNIPILREINIVTTHRDCVPQNAKLSEIDLQQYASSVFSYITALQKENNHLRNTLKDLAVHDYSIHWYRDGKRKILEEFFPYLINELPYYSGGNSVKLPKEKTSKEVT